MKPSQKASLWHLVTSLLMSLGLTLPLLRILGLTGMFLPACGVCILLTGILSAGSLHRTVRIAVPCLLGVSAAGWLAFAGGLGTLREIAIALLLHAQGVSAALPLYALQTALALSALLSLLSFVLTLRSAGPVPACLGAVLMLVLIWQTGDAGDLLLLLPALIAALSLTAQTVHDQASAFRALPAMAAVALIAVLAVPSQGVVIPEWQQMIQDTRQKILDYFFFTQPRDVFSLANEGYAPQGILQLGGPASPDDRPVMQVQTPRKAYLRGVIRNEYTGRSWIDTTGGRRYQWISPRWQSNRSSLFDSALPSQVISASSLLEPETLTIRMVSSAQSTLFVPQRVRMLSVSGNMTPYFNNASEIFITRNLAPGDTYSVSAILASADDPGMETLINACAASGDAQQYEDVRTAFSFLPGHLQSQVTELSHSVTMGAETPFAKAMAIRNWLRRNCRYTLDTAEQPENVDFVTSFLLDTKEGYCTYFASAMAVMCRMNGLPARYVEGYVADPVNGLANVTGMDAHAWVEVFFQGFGWMPFDPTPMVGDGSGDSTDKNDPPTPEPSPTPSPTPTPQPEEPDHTPAPDEEPEPSAPPQPETPDEVPSPQPPPAEPESPEEDAQPPVSLWWLWVVVLLLILALLFRILWTDPAHCARRKKEANRQWAVWLQALCQTLALSGLPIQPGESMLAYLRRADTDGDLEIIGLWSSAIFYGRDTATPSAIRQVQEAYAARHAKLPRIKRLHFLWLRLTGKKDRRIHF